MKRFDLTDDSKSVGDTTEKFSINGALKILSSWRQSLPIIGSHFNARRMEHVCGHVLQKQLGTISIKLFHSRKVI